MPALAGVVLSPLLLEDDDLFAAPVTDDFAGHARALERGNTGFDVLAVVSEEDVVEFDLPPLFTGDGGDLVSATGLDTELLAAGLDIA